MRHLEATQKTLQLIIANTAVSSAEAIKTRDLRIAHLEGQHVKVMEMVERLIDGTHQRELAAASQVAKEKRTDEMWQSMRLIGAPIVAQVLPKMLGAQAATMGAAVQNEMQLVAWFTSLTNEQAEAFLERMSDPQRINFLQMYKRLVLDRIKEPAGGAAESPSSPEKH
jgi:hypothetical protein